MVAFVAMMLGIPARVFLPSISLPAKAEHIREFDAELVVGGDHHADAFAASEHWLAQFGALPVHAFDRAETMLGQGTI